MEKEPITSQGLEKLKKELEEKEKTYHGFWAQSL